MHKFNNSFATFFIVISILSSNTVCGQDHSQGLLGIYFNDMSDTIRENRIWFKDSTLIYEISIFFSIGTQTDTSETRKESYQIVKYSYIDLRTRNCQDYWDLSDTATVLYNYHIQPNEFISNNQCSNQCTANSPYSCFDKYTFITDTTIQNQLYKRMRLVDSLDQEFIFYLNCNGNRHIYHFNNLVASMFPDCDIPRYEFRSLTQGDKKFFNEYKILKQTLTEKEERIFEQWKKNAAETRLPLITTAEATKAEFQSDYFRKKFNLY